MGRGSSRAFARSRWFVLAVCLVIGGVAVLVSWLGGQLATGLIAVVILAGFGLVIALAGGSETIRGCAAMAATSGSRRSTCARPPRPGRC
jgi:hypothetical protein